MIPRAIRGPAILKKYIFGSGGISENLKLLSNIRNGINTKRLKRNLKKRSMETGTSGPRIFYQHGHYCKHKMLKIILIIFRFVGFAETAKY